LQAYLRAGSIDYGDDDPPIDVREIVKSFEVDWENPILKSKDVTQASTLDLHGAFVRRTDLSGASLRGANMIKVDATNAVFRGADFEGALLDGAILRGADLTGAKN